MLLQIMFLQIMFLRSLRFLTSSPMGRRDARFPPSCFDRTVFPLGMARMFWPFLTLESVSLVVRTVAALYSFSMTAATSSILAIGWRKIAYGRRSPDRSLDVSLDDGYFWTIRGPAHEAGLLVRFS
jgi:hypothetical protein